MEISGEIFNSLQEQKWQDLGNGMSRAICGYDTNIMMVKVKFEKGAIGAVHAHPHSQTSYVLEGEFEISIAGKKQILRSGDSFYAAPNVMHGAKCLKTGILLDVFSPFREDFLV
jgi:quercetin dioxygenase-like cupin family protein